MRRKPYTKRGISRVPCFKCGKPSTQQWRICALGEWLGVCTECDIEMNLVVLKFIFGRNYKKFIDKYRKKRFECVNKETR